MITTRKGNWGDVHKKINNSGMSLGLRLEVFDDFFALMQ